MSRKVKVYPVEKLVEEIDQQLDRYKVDSVGLPFREKVLKLVELHYQFRCLGVSVAVEEGFSKTSGTSRILSYFTAHVGVILEGAELDVVSGISEYARRIRQLRVEDGYKIVSGASPDKFTEVDLNIDQYKLVEANADHTAARRWHLANRIRRQKGSSQSRVLDYLKANVGEVVTTEELAYVAKDRKEFGRRTRELRTEQGYSVATRFTGRPDLKSGEYVLQSLDRIAPEHDRHVTAEVQKIVYERDGNICRSDGWNWDMWTPQDPRFLELHHVEHHARGGSNLPDNLIVLCSKCHDKVHSGKLDLEQILK